MPTFNEREMAQRHQEISERLRELANEAEARDLNEAERSEADQLRRELTSLQLRQSSLLASRSGAPAAARDLDTEMREAIAGGSRVFQLQRREAMMSGSLANTGVLPITEQEMLKPLRAGLIYDMLGISIRHGLVNELRWPTHGKATAKWVGEGEAAFDTSINFDKLLMEGEEITTALPVTRKTLDDSEGVVENVVREELPMAVADKINAAMFATTASAANSHQPTGPFVSCDRVNFAAAVPTRKELLKIKAKVAAAGIKFVAPCWVMDEATKAELEDTKVDAGSGRFVCENDRILGYPVYTTPDIGAGNVGFGDFSYLAAGFFGKPSLIVDPYTLARNGEIDFVLRNRFGMAVLRPEAFVLGVPHA